MNKFFILFSNEPVGICTNYSSQNTTERGPLKISNQNQNLDVGKNFANSADPSSKEAAMCVGVAGMLSHSGHSNKKQSPVFILVGNLGPAHPQQLLQTAQGEQRLGVLHRLVQQAVHHAAALELCQGLGTLELLRDLGIWGTFTLRSERRCCDATDGRPHVMDSGKSEWGNAKCIICAFLYSPHFRATFAFFFAPHLDKWKTSGGAKEGISVHWQ